MSPKIPVAKPKEIIRALKKLGFIIQKQKGSHIFLYHPEIYPERYIIVPYHNKDVRPGIMHEILSHPAVDDDKFIELL
jgi:predicted RNA binding protein YcfA (HicA-like mRNA interferase family)